MPTYKVEITCLLVLVILGLVLAISPRCQQDKNCRLPECFCATFKHPLINVSDIPQMVYFGFDDALTPLVDPIYKKLFPSNRTNPNGCSIGMTLFVSDTYTSYSDVKYFYDMGMEIASHSVHHGHTNKEAVLYSEAKQQKANLVKRGHIPESEIIGWRSPFLETAGDVQPDTLKRLGYKYDISLTFNRGSMVNPNPWPFTADYGWPYRCQMKPCLSSSHPRFWEFPVNSMIDFKGEYPCNYLDGCMNRPSNEVEAFKYLMDNFNNAFNGNRAPLGIHMHAGWLLTNHNFRAMDRFIKEMLRRENVYILPVKQVLNWMQYPTPLSKIKQFTPWQCKKSKVTEFKTTTTEQPTTPKTERPTTPKPTLPTTVKPSTKMATEPFQRKTAKPTFSWLSWLTRITTKRSTVNQKKSTAAKKLFSKTTEVPFVGVSTKSKVQNVAKILTETIYSVTRMRTQSPTIQPVTSGASRHNFDWLWAPINLFKNPSHQVLHVQPKISNPKLVSDAVCMQGVNCKLPDCFCKGSKLSDDLGHNETPQFVYISFDGNVDSQVFFRYKNIFGGQRKNPDNCPISSTFFVTQRGSRDSHISYLYNISQEISFRGSSASHISSIYELNKELREQKDKIAKLGVQYFGWRSPELKPLGDEQYTTLANHGLLYDSTLVLQESSKEKSWPFTLDFGWNENCVIPECPKKRHQGLWEVPNVPVLDYKNMYPCNYADGCMFSPSTAEETFQFLWNNFMQYYKSNKAPFGLNFRHIWFSHPAYRKNLRGFEMFIDKLVQMEDVYISSISKIIQWMQHQVSLSKMALRSQC